MTNLVTRVAHKAEGLALLTTTGLNGDPHPGHICLGEGGGCLLTRRAFWTLDSCVLPVISARCRLAISCARHLTIVDAKVRSFSLNLAKCVINITYMPCVQLLKCA